MPVSGVSDSSNPVRALLGPRAQQVGILEHAELLVTCASANQRNDAGIRCTQGVRESRCRQHVAPNRLQGCAQRLAEVRVHLRFLRPRMDHVNCWLGSLREWVAVGSSRLQDLQSECFLATPVQDCRCVQQLDTATRVLQERHTPVGLILSQLVLKAADMPLQNTCGHFFIQTLRDERL